MKRLAKALRYAAAAAVCVLAATTAVDAAVAKQVRLVQVMHRHGARSTIATYNNTQLCTEAPCGYLTSAGVTMMQNVGAFVRSRYNEDAAVVDAPYFPSDTYNLDVVYTRSTDVLRTLQSAESFLRGLFPNPQNFLPAVHTQPEDFDRLLNSDVLPWIHYFNEVDRTLLRAVTDPTTDKMFPQWEELTKIGASIFSEGHCNVYAQRTDCASDLFDIAAAKRAMGLIDSFPLLRDNFDKLRAVTRATFEYEFHFDKSDDLHLRQGGRGQPFLQELVENMDKAIKGTNKFKLMHYSAHDTTLSPVWGSLGDRTDYGMLPLFAQTMVTELLQDATDQSYHVRVLRGHPGQTPESNHVFGWDDTWKMRCVGADGAMYEAKDNTCPLDDFKRLVDWSKPTAAEGLCYLDDQFLAARACTNATVGAGQSGPALTETCIFYRERCPEFSCGKECSLNAVSLQCVCADSTNPAPGLAQNSGLGTLAVVGISVGTFCVGCIIAAGAVVALYLCRRRSTKAEREPFVEMRTVSED